jgi:uncharacterized repeat protein (TIGR02543 family)
MVKKNILLLFSVSSLFFLLCAIVQNNPLDEDSPYFEKPVIGIDTAKSTIKPDVTIHCDSGTLILQGKRPETRFRVGLDSLPLSPWKAGGPFAFSSLRNGRHLMRLHAMYYGGNIFFKDSFFFFVATSEQKPIFPRMKDTAFSVRLGGLLTFPLHAEGSAPISYQWYKDSSIITGMTDTIFIVDSFSIKDTGTYRCIASNQFGSDTSRLIRFQIPSFKSRAKGAVISALNGSKLSCAIVSLNPGKATAITTNDGLFSFDSLIPGTYSIAIILAGYREFTSAPMEIQDSSITDLGVFILIPIDRNIIIYRGNGNTGGDAPMDSNKYSLGDSVTVLGKGSLIKARCSFAGWNTQADGSGKNYLIGSKFPMLSASITLFAQWIPVSDTVTFNDQGATTPVKPKTILVTFPDSTVGSLPTPPVKQGYTFGGWNTKADASGSNVTANTAVTSNLSVYAKWIPISDTVTFNDQGATTPVKPKTIIVIFPDSTISSLPTAPTRTGYTFEGWNTKADSSGTQFTASTKVISTITVFAKWIPVSDTVTFNDQGATTPVKPKTIIVTFPDSTISSLPTAPTRTGYTFEGWNTKADGGGTPFSDTTLVTKTFTVYAKWLPISDTVTFNDQEATTPVSPKIKIVTFPDSTVGLLPTPPSKTGYNFANWYTKVDGGGIKFTQNTIVKTTVSKNITVFAKWIPISDTVIFDDQGATTPVNPKMIIVTYPDNSIGTLPDEPSKTHFTFHGWNTRADGSGTKFTAKSTVNTTVIKNLTVYAKWNPVSYTVTYDDLGADSPEDPTSQTVTWPDTTVGTLPTDPEKDDCIFTGWEIVDNEGNGIGVKFTEKTVVTEDVSVKAGWKCSPLSQ